MNTVESVQRPPATSRGGGAAEPTGTVRVPRRSSLAVYWLPVATLVVGLLVTGTLVLVSHSQYLSNETRLLNLRVRDAASLLAESLPATEATMASAVEQANSTNGNVARFQRLVASQVGSQAGRFVSLSLWKINALDKGPVVIAGVAPKLAATPGNASTFLGAAARRPTLSVIGLLHAPSLRLGYAFANPAESGGYVVYGERPLPANRRSRLQSTSQFAGLDYAVYLGRKQTPENLVLTDRTHLPLPSPSVAQSVPYGSNALTLAMSSRVPLAGSLPKDLPWIIAVLGALLAIAAAAITLRLTHSRRCAEDLAGRLEITANENERLYAEQRGISQTLQHALLPDTLPQIPGIQASARYEAGEQGIEIGGDWYDVIDLDGRRLLLVVGDVSGRGLRAATTMAALRYAIRAYAAQNDGPAEILTKISRLVNVSESGQLATVLCATVDRQERQLSVTSAGHLPALLLTNGEGHYVEMEIGLPIGVEAGTVYQSTTVTAPPEATLVAFTDGLVERRGETIDQGLDRLRAAATSHDVGLPELLGKLVSEMANGRSEDDIAIVGVRWTN
ncbi:MAG: PP2C family protein-serine/threonine phosphatase [Solirubrobacteraceae bacterium]